MRRFYTFIIFSSVVGILLSFISFDSTTSSKLLVGDKFPKTELLGDNKGNLVLVNFWAAYDAESRDENVQFSSIAEKYDEKTTEEGQRLRSMSVSMDRFEKVFEEVVKQDGLRFSKVSIETEGFHSKLAKDLKLNNRFGNFLIDDQGKIIAKDFTPEELKQMLDRYLN
ncbi:MAG TPA: thioredoxin-like domain-containing protein [Paludibacteraceae bacterium]|nr:thioredoxin-like domain-containing protein [Paludibacteraceae bacterium]HOU69674.1 thioredoxin-like domain-containing protein [Paludibacteraceae bacterium]HPH63593.1 thioredoxin-like domain-containing protein [Paludibacteraceae bacterium]HQF51287.1 thioredoxin-like domain-containing protein [Paludibacteraceae bacterium]